MKNNIDKESKELLWKTCKEWIDKEKPTCPESIVQIDSVNLSLPDLAESICNIVGYYDSN